MGLFNLIARIVSKGSNMSGTVIEDVSLNDLKAGLADGSVLLVDVREPDEFRAGHIPGSTLNALSAFNPSALPQVEGKRVVLSCRSGNRSKTALRMAQAAGRTDVRAHFTGGIMEWVQAGQPVA